ncbi:MAG TPA: biotin/lipoyl-containing protein, partial [Dehalococcoidia bacterium]|nr:biotin/lipoyl-containing protein [Dehalococcoidia bacterium]
MAAEILMPKLGMIMTEGEVTRWLKAPGEPVRRGEVILEVTTEKINYEVEAAADGILHSVVPEGQTVPVGAVVGFVLAPGEAPPAVVPPPRPVEVTDPDAPRSAVGPVTTGSGAGAVAKGSGDVPLIPISTGT